MAKQLGSFYIITDDQKNDDIVLFLVDRSKQSHEHDGGRQWWTHHIERAIAFTSRAAANEQVKKYSYGNPRVIDENQAQQCATDNRDWLAEQRHPMDLEDEHGTT